MGVTIKKAMLFPDCMGQLRQILMKLLDEYTNESALHIAYEQCLFSTLMIEPAKLVLVSEKEEMENAEKVREIADTILQICREPQTSENILKRLFDIYQLTMNFEQYVLVGSTVRSYLTWLKEQGRLQARFEENWLVWEA